MKLLARIHEATPARGIDEELRHQESGLWGARPLGCHPVHKTPHVAAHLTGDDRVRARLRGRGAGENLAHEIFTACRAQCLVSLGGLAERIESVHAWDDLVVPPSVKEKLRSIESWLRCRHVVYDDWGFAERVSVGRGMAAMFASSASARQFALAGGSVKNCAVAAALAAAAKEKPVGMRHLVRAVAREYEKLGKPSTPALFEPFAALLR